MSGTGKSWNPLVSVIINCYNGEKYLKETIASVFSQTYENWEIIFWDNASTDGSASIAKSHGDKLRYFRGEENILLGAARNKAMEKARGELIGFLDCDDVWLPHKLERQVELMSGGCALCYGGNILINASGQRIGLDVPKAQTGDFFERLLRQFDINVPTTMINKAALDASGLTFDSTLTASEEYCLFMQFAIGREFICIGEALAKYRIHDEALTGKAIERWAIEREYTLAKIIERNPGIDIRFSKAFRVARARGKYYRARYLVHVGEKVSARKELYPLIGIDIRYLALWLVLWLPKNAWTFIHEKKTFRTRAEGNAKKAYPFDLSRPDLIYACIWGFVYCLLLLPMFPKVVKLNNAINWMILINVISFFVVYYCVEKFSRQKKHANSEEAVFQSTPELKMLEKFTRICLIIWLPCYAVNIVASGGLPIFWLFDGSGRTYVNFGLPTFSGLLNMVRAFIFSAFVLLYMQKRERKYLIFCVLFFISLSLEMNRGGKIFLLLHGVGMYLLHQKRLLKALRFLITLCVFLVLDFGFFGELRGSHAQMNEVFSSKPQWSVNMPSGFAWVYMYISTPAINLHFAGNEGITPVGNPYWSIQFILPTVVRRLFFPEKVYPLVLFDDAYNATTFYSPLIADFGSIIACILVILIQIIVARCHIMARAGSIRHILIYPVLFASTVLSFFYMYFFNLVTVMYPLLVLAYFIWKRRSQKCT